jgi:hypothetical protein
MTAQTIQYVTLDELKNELGIPVDFVGEDERLTNNIYQASAMVKNYLGNKSAYMAALDMDDEPELDSNFEPILESWTGEPVTQVRHEVRLATILLIRIMRFDPMSLGKGGYLPDAVAAILYPLRDPQLK